MVTVVGDKVYRKRSTPLVPSICTHCGATNSLELTCVLSYFHIFFIPVFPNRKTGFTQCKHCGDIQPVDKKQVSITDNPTIVRFCKSSDQAWWTWVGTPIFLLLFAWIISTKILPNTSTAHTTTMPACLEQVQPAQLFAIQTGSNSKRILRIKYTGVNGLIAYQIGDVEIPLNQSFDLSKNAIYQQFETPTKSIANIKTTDSEQFKKLPIINCY